MAKIFNVTGPCIPAKHYMTDLTERIAQIQRMVDAGAYFTINRARQYGKTTTLALLDEALKEEYLVVRLDFQLLGSASFRNESVFSQAFSQNQDIDPHFKSFFKRVETTGSRNAKDGRTYGAYEGSLWKKG